MTESQAWLTQIESDLSSAEILLEHKTPQIHCQLIAKYQQITEKSIKAIEAILREKQVIHGRINAGHHPDRIISAIVRIARDRRHPVSGYLSKTFSGQRRIDVEALCSLAPRLPEPGELYRKNTEYPFNTNSASDWTAPGMPNTFTENEITRFRSTALRLRESAIRIVYAENLSKNAIKHELK